MLKISYLDSYGNYVKHLTQWDVNQVLYAEYWNYDVVPIFHFCNTASEEALVVKGEIINGSAKANIPNLLLQQPYPITVFVYLEDDDSGKTIFASEIPVRKKPKPEDYEYVENIGYTSWVKMEEEIKALISEISNSNEQLKQDYENSYNSFTAELTQLTNQFKSEYESTLGTAKENADRAKESADYIDGKLVDKGDNLEFDKETNLLYLTSDGNRISSGISISTKITATDDGNGNVFLIF